MGKLQKYPKRIITTLLMFLALIFPATTVVTANDFENNNPIPDFAQINVNDNLTIDVIEVNGIDVIEIYNPTDRAISCKGMYLTDDVENLFMWQMPSIIVRAGQTIQVKSNNDEVTHVLKRAVVNFDVSSSESIRLTDASGEVIAIWLQSFMSEVVHYANSKGYRLTEYEPLPWGDTHTMLLSVFENSNYRIYMNFVKDGNGIYYFLECNVAAFPSLEFVETYYLGFDWDPSDFWKTFFDRYA